MFVKMNKTRVINAGNTKMVEINFKIHNFCIRNFIDVNNGIFLDI